jgi:hypothetical protein
MNSSKYLASVQLVSSLLTLFLLPSFMTSELLKIMNRRLGIGVDLVIIFIREGVQKVRSSVLHRPSLAS